MEKEHRITISDIVIIVIGCIFCICLIYHACPALNLRSNKTWGILLTCLFLIPGLFLLKNMFMIQYEKKKEEVNPLYQRRSHILPRGIGILFGIFLVFLGFYILLHFFSSKLFHAKEYASLITVQETATFHEDIPQYESISRIALMDTESARILGNRMLGELSDIISQYEVSDFYNQINYHSSPMKIAPLEYADLFKYWNNRKKGIPGYVLVDPYKNTADYIALEEPMLYSPSAYFNYNLYRHLRFTYPTKIFREAVFEIDEEGKPYYIVPVSKPQIGAFGAYDVVGAIICNPCTGDSDYYSLADVPKWVDLLYDGDLICQKYNWRGMLSNGYWNSIFGNEGCKKTTSDFGYIAIEEDIYIYTGVTSVNSDRSNVGFIMANGRTGEYRFYQVAGADEFSAMSAAQGAVQEKKYQASFPTLINIEGHPTYICVLKDAAGLVKLYAMINVNNYGLVATGVSQEEVLRNYKNLFLSKGVMEPGKGEQDGFLQSDIIVERILFLTRNGEEFVYLLDETGRTFRRSFELDEALVTIKEKDKLFICYEETEIEGLYEIMDWKKK